jgi:hypothetical protein
MVAVQLAAALPALEPHICAATSAMCDADDTVLQVQWQRLVLQPLAEVRGGLRRLLPRKPVVIIVDVLDECDSERDTVAILGRLAFSASAEQAQWLRVLMTSRPKTRIRYGIQGISQACLDRLILHEVDAAFINQNISVNLADNLCRIGAELLYDADWPGAKTLDELVTQAGGLFIWAATDYRFISHGKAFAKDRLQDVLRGISDPSAPQLSLDSIYMAVLDRAGSEDLREQKQSQLCAILHAVLGLSFC